MENNGKTVLPRKVTEANFNKALGKLRELLGEENVLLKNEQIAPYMKVMMPKPEADLRLRR